MEIKVGEYVRTKNGIIRKIYKIEKCEICEENLYINIEIIKDLHFTNSYHTKDITRHSKNIIDLIEIGDFVNGYKVLEIRRNDNRILIGVYKDTENVIYKTLANENVKTILTHEQFEQNAYRLEEK